MDSGIIQPLETRKVETQASINALNNIHPLAVLSERTPGSLLRALHWNLAAGLDELGRILGAAGKFPNLKELIVTSNGTNRNFNFIQIGGLEVLGITYRIEYEDGERLCYKLAEALQMLPYSSPLLHTLQLNLKIPCDEEEDYPFPSEAYEELVDSINRIHLPALTILDLTILDLSEDFEAPSSTTADFAAFLASHPNLVHLTFDARGTELSSDISFLPCLRSFKGSFEDSAIVCAHERQLEMLFITFTRPFHSYERPTFSTFPLPTHVSLTRLHVTALDTLGQVVKTTSELSPESFAHLVISFPNLTQLDICISGAITEYYTDIILLTKLQSVRILEYRTSRLPPPRRPITEILSHIEYQEFFASFAPFLPWLARIEICILADNLEWQEDHSESDYSVDSDMEFDLMWSPPEMKVTYCFSVIRNSSGVRVGLDHTEIS
ncbi:hypothetical protein DFH09DRAFT_1140602 [Mycena vulgaris]|nr:hypothetical protein DFH09DRAFT_1140602 [Mycena vulgaris]